MNSELPEFLLGLPHGWVTAVPGLPYAAMIKALGNGVVPQQAAAALRLLLQVAASFPADSGLTGEHGKEVAA
jgi:DNA (cytosine-5)-methyltransferase 1